MSVTTLETKARKYRAPARGSRLVPPRLERWVNRTTIKSPAFRSVVSFFILPLIWRLGPKINYDHEDFFVETPHSRINRNSYGTVGGAALLANLELAAGCYLFMHTNGGHRIVCRGVNYRFMLPSVNGLHFRVEPLTEYLPDLIERAEPFNAELKVYVYARGDSFGEKGRRIGRGEIKFHLWPVRAEA